MKAYQVLTDEQEKLSVVHELNTCAAVTSDNRTAGPSQRHRQDLDSPQGMHDDDRETALHSA